jgi:hypothetical protein
MSEQIGWPSRKEWAKQMRTPYWDLMPESSTKIADYATTDEVAALEVALHDRWKALGREMRRLGEKGEDGRRELWCKRRAINRALKLIKKGELPICLEDFRWCQGYLG